MGFVYESYIPEAEKLDIALGVKLTNEKSIFKPIYSIVEQTKENLKSLLLTRFGERYMLPEFGTNLLDCLFEPITYEFNDKIQKSIRSAIEKWLPYIVIERFIVKTALDDPNLQHAVEITLTYSVRNFSTATIKIFATEDGVVSIE